MGDDHTDGVNVSPFDLEGVQQLARDATPEHHRALEARRRQPRHPRQRVGVGPGGRQRDVGRVLFMQGLRGRALLREGAIRVSRETRPAYLMLWIRPLWLVAR
jgi:hypothetical protein